MKRRTFIGAAAGAGLAGLAGCGASASPTPPQVPEERLEEGGWKRTDAFTEEVFEREFAGVTVTATAVTRIYDDAALAAEIEEKTLGAVQAQQASFFATRVTFDPNLADLPGGVGREELIDRTEEEARASFRARLEDAGLTNIEQSGTGTFEPATADVEGRRTDYTADFAFDAMEFPVSEDRTVTVEGGAIGVSGTLAVWVTEEGVLVTGGAHPAENFERTVEEELSEAITVTVDMDLGLTPEEYRTELQGLMTNVR